jgi:hypothetical protein
VKYFEFLERLECLCYPWWATQALPINLGYDYHKWNHSWWGLYLVYVNECLTMGAGQPGSPIIEQRAGTFECNFWEGKEG